MAKAKEGDEVKVHYTGKLDNGMTFDTSVDRSPLEFTIGKGMLLPGFESAVIGLEPGETKNIQIPAEEAYGTREDGLIGEIPRDRLPDDLNPQVGMKLQMKRPDGETLIVTITDLDDTQITVDANHHLAGEDLHFKIELVEIL